MKAASPSCTHWPHPHLLANTFVLMVALFIEEEAVYTFTLLHRPVSCALAPGINTNDQQHVTVLAGKNEHWRCQEKLVRCATFSSCILASFSRHDENTTTTYVKTHLVSSLIRLSVFAYVIAENLIVTRQT